MPAQIDEIQRYDADPATVFAMLSDETFIIYKCEQSASLDVVAKVQPDGENIRIHNRRVLPAKVPSYVKKFLGDTIPLDETQFWTQADENGSRTATFDVDFDGQPLKFSGTITLQPGGDGTAVRTRGPIKGSVPLIGGKVESFAAGWIGKYLAKEQKVGAQWLADHAGP